MSDPALPPSPDLYCDFFRRQTWPAKWESAKFSPDQWRMKVYNRARSKPKPLQGLAEGFLVHFMNSIRNWPWGFFIYRTTYGSDEDWNQALAKLHRHIHNSIRYWATLLECSPEQTKEELEAVEIVIEGCHNIIIEDREILEGASPARVRQLFNEWLKRNPEYNNHASPRSAFCLMIDDHAVQSILASAEPCPGPGYYTPKQPGYTILIDRSFPDKGGIRHEPYNVGWIRLTMGGDWQIWCRASTYDDVELEDVFPPIGRPGLIPYYDGDWTWAEDVNGQEVDNPSDGEPEDWEDEEDEDADGYTEEGGYPLHDIYEYLRERGYI